MEFLRILISICLLIKFLSSDASHIRAGEIIARQISGNTYSFTFIGYRDSEPPNVLFGNGIFDFGDGTTFGGENEAIPWQEPEIIGEPGDFIERWEFTLPPKTYAAGSVYLVSYTEIYRNRDIQNISESSGTAFQVETLLRVDPLISNSTPFFTSPPIDQGVVGVIFEHDPAAFDPDGDSLVFYFVTPKQASSLDVGGYRQLN
ncbi:MAG: gliding motility-associated C-terminal domain-containing protein, partial [Bacteroidota bacterium]